MSWRNYLLAIASIGLLLSVYHKVDESNGITGTAGEPASLAITLKGNGVKNMGQPAQVQENAIADFAICVCNGVSILLEKIETFDNTNFTPTYTLPVTSANYSGLTSELFDLSTPTK